MSKALGIKATDSDYDIVRDVLEEMEDTGVIFKTSRRRYGRAVPNVAIEGRLQNLKGGRWQVTPPDDPKGGYEIDGHSLWTAMHGDLVRAKMTVAPLNGERPHGEITRVIERANPTMVGTLKRGREFYLDPDDKKMHRTITIRRRGLNGAKAGDKVLVKLYDWIDPYEDPEGNVIETLGRAGEMNAEIASIAAAYRLPHVFPPDVIEESESFPAEYTEEDLRGRRDLRDMAIMTIDPADARDFDDAISIEEHEDGDVTLGIHIADVGHYVREGSALDLEALKRGTSVYLVTGVIPMLPERLSNDLCSLRPNEDRLAYSVFVRLTPRGAIRDYEITKSIINSKRRFSYEEALEVLETGEGDFASELKAINKMAHVLRDLRRRKGSVDFDRPELKFKLDEHNHPVEVVQKRATESTRLIEDCMLLANRVVAEHIGKQRKGKSVVRGGAQNPFIYRIHDVPPKEKLLELASFLKTIGLSIPTENVQPKDIQQVIVRAKGTEYEDMVTEMTLRSMAKAVYSEHNVGHFGLAYTYYTHFTSPIRRYPDLIVHRLLFEYGLGMSNERRAYHTRELGPIADRCSERERAAVEAERESVKIAQVEFLKDHVGEMYEATISGLMPFGIFAKLKNLGIEGLVRLRSLGDDYYIFDERAKTFRGQRSKKVFHMGDDIFVRVVRVDEMNSEIDMEMIEESEFLGDGERKRRSIKPLFPTRPVVVAEEEPPVRKPKKEAQVTGKSASRKKPAAKAKAAPKRKTGGRR
ncbi:MAG: ribonuclease R [Bacteroidota bacterium]